MSRSFITPFLAIGLSIPLDLGLTPSLPVAQVLPQKVRLPSYNQKLYGRHVIRIAKKYRIDPGLLWAVITIESGWNVDAVSNVGAMGLMQLMPETARMFGVKNPFNPLENIKGGARYLRYLLNLFNNNVTLTVAAYNAGHGRVLKTKGVPKIKQTQEYVQLVMKEYNDFDQPRLFLQ